MLSQLKEKFTSKNIFYKCFLFILSKPKILAFKCYKNTTPAKLPITKINTTISRICGISLLL